MLTVSVVGLDGVQGLSKHPSPAVTVKVTAMSTMPGPAGSAAASWLGVTTRTLGAEIELRIAPSARGGASHGPEEYRVEVGARALLEAQTTAGLANAWKTLRQLVRSGDGSPARIRRCTVHDWPSLDFRGILFFTGKDAGDELPAPLPPETAEAAAAALAAAAEDPRRMEPPRSGHDRLPGPEPAAS